MPEKIKVEIELIKSAVRAFCSPVAIYLFGSYAYGAPHNNSDLDIYVVVPDNIADTFALSVEIRTSICFKRTMPLDLLIGRKSRFENRKKRLTLEKTIYDKGIKIYG